MVTRVWERGKGFTTKGCKGIWGVMEFFLNVVVTQPCAFIKTPKKDGFLLYANCASSFKNLNVEKKKTGKIFRINMSNPEVIQIYIDTSRPNR